jgi:YHS domain-containing protein
MMTFLRPIICCLILLAGNYLQAQSKYNSSGNALAVKGYDLVSYFEGKAQEGKEDFYTTYDGLKYQFISERNKELFMAEPMKYLPQYGGWCAWAMSTSGEKVDIDPETFEIREGKLYLFYNKFFNNTYKSWIEEGPEKLIPVGDKNWKKKG